MNVHVASHSRAYRRDLAIRFIIAIIGFAPITALAAAIFGFGSLWSAVMILVLPGAAMLAELLWLKPHYRTIAVSGFVFGLIAVTLYDLFRVPWVLSGLWGDFIPKIGQWLLEDDHAHPTIGYLYRYIGDGGGLGMAYVAIYPLLHRFIPNRVLSGLLYGVFVWACLMATLLVAPHAQEKLFSLTPLKVTLSLCGHLIYGGTLGVLMGNARALALTHAAPQTAYEPARA